MELLIGADLVPTKSNIDLFNCGDINSLLGPKLWKLWKSADIRIFNLEVPLINKEYPIDKCGPNLIAPLSTINGIKALNPTLITLANNHILDHGVEGLLSTQDILRATEIAFVGAGRNISEASKPYIINYQELKIGIYSCAEHEFTIATNKSAGANPFDPLESFEHISDLKKECDYVIVLYHGGKEHYRYPSPYLQRVCRKMAQKGADLVICQHSHCIGCLERYNETSIIYGQGNFIFDLSDSEFWNTSLLIRLNIKEGFNIEYIPIVKEKGGIRLADDSEATQILNEFYRRSDEILEDEFIEENYKAFAIENVRQYLRGFSGLGKWISRIDRKLLNDMLLRKGYNKNKLLMIQNFIECEAHRELLIEGLKNKSGKN